AIFSLIPSYLDEGMCISECLDILIFLKDHHRESEEIVSNWLERHPLQESSKESVALRMQFFAFFTENLQFTEYPSQLSLGYIGQALIWTDRLLQSTNDKAELSLIMNFIDKLRRCNSNWQLNERMKALKSRCCQKLT